MVKNPIKSFATSALAAVLLASSGFTSSASEAPMPTRMKGISTAENPFPYARKAKPGKLEQQLAEFHFGHKQTSGAQRAATKDPDMTLGNSSEFGYLNGPDGRTWYYTSKSLTERIFHDYGFGNGAGWYETITKGVEYTIYNADFKEIGTVKANVEGTSGMGKINNVRIDPAISKNFFNSDSKYEVMIYVQGNPEAGYGSVIQTNVYSIGGQKEEDGSDKCIAVFPGYTVDAVNLPQDRFSENYYITFVEEYNPNYDDFESAIDYANATGRILKTYKKASWGSNTVISEHLIRNNQCPGDQENSTPLFVYNGGSYASSYGASTVPMITYVEYEKPFWVNPLGFNPDLTPDDPDFNNIDESPTADNSLLITTYRLDMPSSTTATLVSEHRIPLTQTTDFYCTYYSIGGLNYEKDIDVEYPAGGGYGVIKGYTVCSQNLTKKSEDLTNTCFRYYNTEGQLVNTIAENADSFVTMSDIDGEEPEVMIVEQQDSRYYFSFVNARTGEENFAIPQTLDGNALKMNIDRVKIGGSILYVAECTDQDYELDDDFNVLKKIAIFNKEGEIVRIDRLNLGQDIAISQVYIDQSVLNPYLFDCDDDLEYMVLLKRYTDSSSSTETREEFLVIDPTEGAIITALPDAEKGSLATISVIEKQDPRLVIVWMTTDEKGSHIFNQDFYFLPFERFTAGDGTEANPYQISSAVHMRFLADEPAAHYVITNDIDMDGISFTPVDNFSGSLDGQGHTISNLTISSSTASVGMFTRTDGKNNGETFDGARIGNFTLLNPVLNVTSTQNYAGFVAANGFGCQISNVNVFGGKINVADDFDGKLGVIAGQLSYFGSISGCAVSGTDIAAPGATEGVGGIAGSMLTSAKVTGSAFCGSVSAASYVGGIVGSADKDVTVSDCHVDADITAGNTVGGIAGYSSRATIARNVIEGTIEATTPNRFNNAISLGGVVGELLGDNGDSMDEGSGEGDDPAVSTGKICISGNVVALESMTYPESTLKTVHRIAGLTSEDPIIVYGDEESIAEKGLKDNYITGGIAQADANKTDDVASIEGKTIDRYDTDIEFYEGLGYKFGTTADAPWAMGNNLNPRLYFESSLTIVPSEITVKEGDNFTVKVLVHSRKEVTVDELAGDLVTNWDEALVENTGMEYADGTLTLSFHALAVGTTVIEVSALGSTVSATVTVAELAGVESIATDSANPLSFNGSEVSCEGAVINVFSMSGALVATGNGSVSTVSLPRGIYVATAAGATLKIAVK